MTEEEAKTKWCPFVRMPIDGSSKVANRGLSSGPHLPGTSCIGSACMAWRVATPAKSGGVDFSSGRHFPPTPSDGHCGLAGKP